jgi:tubulinyl-Tyr carboxypeptidase
VYAPSSLKKKKKTIQPFLFVCACFKKVPLPEIPKTEFLLNRGIPLNKRLASCQNAIGALEYNFTGKCFFSRNKFRPLNRILATGREILTAGLPIQCVEAVFAAIYLTQQMEEIERIPLSFKSRFMNGKTYQHIVCAMWDPKRNKWGGLGLSRRKELGFKPLKFAVCIAA